MISALLVDDHDFIRKSLRRLLEMADDIQVVATASNGVEAVARASSHCPDVAVMDISMPLMDGIEATRQIGVRCLPTRVMMLSMFDSPQYVQRALQVGALGYVLKDTVNDDLLAGVRALFRGQQYFSQKIAAIAQKHIDQHGKEW